MLGLGCLCEYSGLPTIFCDSLDLQAGVVIAQEAGGFVTGSKDAPHDGDVTEDILTGRKYLVIRGIAATGVRTAPSYEV